MENQIKVGQSCEVAVITDNREYRSLYNNGSTGVIVSEYRSGNAKVIVGYTDMYDKNGSWAVHRGCYKKTGKLTITKVK